MIKRSSLTLVVVSVVFALVLVCYGGLQKSDGLEGEKIYDFLIQRGCNGGYLYSLKYTTNGIPYGKERVVEIVPEDMKLKILPFIKNVTSSSITLKNNSPAIASPHTHTLFFQYNGYMVIEAKYSIEMNQLVFYYSNIFPEIPRSSPLNMKIIVLEMGEDFKESIISIKGEDILGN